MIEFWAPLIIAHIWMAKNRPKRGLLWLAIALVNFIALSFRRFK